MLITLVIIGVIAALTIPTLMKNYRKHEIETMLKQNYSLIKNALTMAQAEYGDPTGWAEIDHPSQSSEIDTKAFFEKYFIPYIKTIKNGKQKYSALGYRIPVTYPDGTIFQNLDISSNKYLLNNGSTIIAISTSGGTKSDGTRIMHSIILLVDLNGAKGPNVLAKDIFMYYIPLDSKGNVDLNIQYNFDANTGTFLYHNTPTHDKILNSCKRIVVENALPGVGACGKLIQLNGWKIPDDYPLKF